MIDSNSWDWEKEKDALWLTPCEESYYFCEKWQHEGRHSVLDLGCGLGRHSILFAKKGFKVTSIDLSEYSISHLREWEHREHLYIRSKLSDMNKLPFPNNAFDCIFSYHMISCRESDGVRQMIDEIKRVLKPGGEVYLTIPQSYTSLEDLITLFQGFNIERIRQTEDCYSKGKIQHSAHYEITATYMKEEMILDYSSIIGTTVKGKIDRPLGSVHPKFENIIYPINYGYVDGVMAGDGAEQDIYLLGVDHPVDTYEGVVIAVLHRYNDIEDKWIVAPEGIQFTDQEIMEKIYFQEKFFDVELFRK